MDYTKQMEMRLMFASKANDDTFLYRFEDLRVDGRIILKRVLESRMERTH
jgi:hypothetical protein